MTVSDPPDTHGTVAKAITSVSNIYTINPCAYKKSLPIWGTETETTTNSCVHEKKSCLFGPKSLIADPLASHCSGPPVDISELVWGTKLFWEPESQEAMSGARVRNKKQLPTFASICYWVLATVFPKLKHAHARTQCFAFFPNLLWKRHRELLWRAPTATADTDTGPSSVSCSRAPDVTCCWKT